MEEVLEFYSAGYDDLEKLGANDNTADVEVVVGKYCGMLSSTLSLMKEEETEEKMVQWLDNISKMICQARRVPLHGERFSETLCDLVRTSGGLDLVMARLSTDNMHLKYSIAKVLLQVLATTDNKDYVVERGLEEVVAITRDFTSNKKKRDLDQCRLATGLLENLFDHTEETCGKLIELGGLLTLVAECKSKDPETLRHCASALANAAIFGGCENQEKMMECHVPQWLFTLLFNPDITIKARLGNKRDHHHAIISNQNSLNMLKKKTCPNPPLVLGLPGPGHTGRQQGHRGGHTEDGQLQAGPAHPRQAQPSRLLGLRLPGQE